MCDIFDIIKNNDIESLKILLEQDNDLVLNRYGWFDITPLNIVCIYGHLEIAKELLKYKPEEQVLIQDKDKYTSLHYVCLKGHLEIVKELLKYNGNEQVLIQDIDGETSLHYACRKGHLEVVKELLKYGTDQLKIKDTRGISGEEKLKVLLSRQK